jgi:DNA-binding NtrC family response regulator
MAVLAPGRVIRPEDIPDEVRRGRGSSLLPVPVMRAESGERSSVSLRPELEFVFRTLVELRVDMDDLRREFEAYRRSSAEPLGIETFVGRLGGGARVSTGSDGAEIGLIRHERADAERMEDAEVSEPAPKPTDGAVIFRPGMTIEEMERLAIRAALAEVHGNRRKAAELLGIGERTLYRKIAKYDLET